jgi:type IV pilus assembly protein PilN
VIKINLLDSGKKRVKKAAVLGPAQMTTIGCGSILVLALLACGWRYMTVVWDSAKLDNDLAAAQKEAASLHGVIVQLQEFEQQRAKLQQRVGLIEQLRTAQTGPVHMLDQISRALPQMVWLTEVRQTGADDVTIDGKTTSITSVSDFASALEATGYFKKSVEIVSSTTQEVKEGAGILVSFQLKATFQIPGAAKAAGATKPGSGGAAKAAAPAAGAAKSGN